MQECLCYTPTPIFPEKPIAGRFGSTVPFMVLEEGKRYIHRDLDAVTPDEADAFVVPGGFSPDYLRTDAKSLDPLAAAYRAHRTRR